MFSFEMPKAHAKKETRGTPEEERLRLKNQLVWGLSTFASHGARSSEEGAIIARIVSKIESGEPASLSETLVTIPDFFQRVIPANLRDKSVVSQIKQEFFSH